MIRNISAAFAALLISSAALFAQTGGNDPMQGGIIANKTATDNHDGTYTINIDAFVTGTQLTTSSLVSTPVDAVLVLDYSYSMTYKISTGRTSGTGPTRLQALHTAVEQFLKTMKSNQDAYNATQTDDSKKITHRVSIVTFNQTATTRYTLENGLLDSDTKVTNMINAVKGWTTAVYTRSDLGIQKGYDELSKVRDGATPIMVFFTDGEPTSSSDNDFYEPTATAAIKCAYNVKLAKGETGLTLGGKSYKGLGAPVYAVSVIDAKGDMGTFLNNVSSNYPSATSMTSSGTRNTSSTNYLMVAPDEDALETAFVSIARDISSGGASIELDSETITADIVMSDFQIAKTFGTVAKDNIDVYIRKLNSIDGNTYNWSTDKFFADSIKVDVKDDADGNHVVSVVGFDFSKHWCGLDYNNGTATGTHPGGQKLCLDILLVPNPESTGGFIATNHKDSGIYITNESGERELLKSFGVPPSVYAPCDIIIERSGLKSGESAIYKVVRYKGSTLDTSFEREVILTAGADSIATAIIKGDVVYEESGAENLYSYKVIENPVGSRWDFNYTTTSPTGSPASIQQSLYTGDIMTNIFSFTSTKRSGDNALGDDTHDEASKNNKFKRLNTN